MSMTFHQCPVRFPEQGDFHRSPLVCTSSCGTEKPVFFTPHHSNLSFVCSFGPIWPEGAKRKLQMASSKSFDPELWCVPQNCRMVENSQEFVPATAPCSAGQGQPEVTVEQALVSSSAPGLLLRCCGCLWVGGRRVTAVSVGPVALRRDLGLSLGGEEQPLHPRVLPSLRSGGFCVVGLVAGLQAQTRCWVGGWSTAVGPQELPGCTSLLSAPATLSVVLGPWMDAPCHVPTCVFTGDWVSCAAGPAWGVQCAPDHMVGVKTSLPPWLSSSGAREVGAGGKGDGMLHPRRPCLCLSLQENISHGLPIALQAAPSPWQRPPCVSCSLLLAVTAPSSAQLHCPLT